MLGVGWTEMLVIGIVALIVIGPKDLPMMMGRLGKAVSTIRRMGAEFQREINKTTGLDTVADLQALDHRAAEEVGGRDYAGIQ